ncbi:MAG: ArnT family glycosyltransferase [Acetobacterium sp.]
MQQRKKIFQSKNLIYFYLIMYVIINLLFLTAFPYIHSDEPWLSGLSRNILMNHNISVTEPFFDAYERNPHAIKLIFHLLQGGFMQLFGYTIFTFRLISLLFSVGTLCFFYRLCMAIGQSQKSALLTTVLLSLDIQYLYASHLARQEIIILFAMVLSAYLLINQIDKHTYVRDIAIGTVIGLSIGIHPNSFIIALTIGCAYLFFIHKKKIHFKNLLVLIGVVILFSIIFIGLSLYMDPNFFSNYSEHGKDFGAYNGLLGKWSDFGTFYQNVFWGESIEYYMPNIKFQLLLFGLMFMAAVLYSLKGRNKNMVSQLKPIAVMVVSINLGFLLIGRFNVTSIILIFPFMILLTAILLEHGDKKNRLLGLLILITAISTAVQIQPYASQYSEYEHTVSDFIDQDDIVLGNLNSEYAFGNGQFFDYRNLQYLDEKDMSFENYITSRNINTIIYYEELDYIYQNSPKYDVMYGDITTVYPEIQDFLGSHCQEIDSFSDPTYGTNIAPLIDDRQWLVYIFKVTEIP